jgi:hypothetical protein
MSCPYDMASWGLHYKPFMAVIDITLLQDDVFFTTINTTISIMTFSRMTFIIMTFSIMTFSITTFSISTLSIQGLFVTLGIKDTQHNNNLY